MQTVWLDGDFRDAAAAVDAGDRGLLLGDGVFDTALVVGGTVFLGEKHVDRLVAALAVLQIPLDRSAIETAMTALAERQQTGSIRLTVTRGTGPRGLGLPPEPKPMLLGTSAPLAPALMFSPLRCAVSTVRRNETSPLSRLKALGYLDAVLALQKAKEEGADDVLFLNARGMAACSALANLFVVDGFELLTPPLKDGVLPGIIRGWIIDNAENFGLRPLEQSISSKKLDAVDGLFLTNSLRLISPATLSGKAAAADRPETVRRLMEGLCEAIGSACGTDPRDLGARLLLD
ncbi:4-amino-4-deoxychorismate lyase [Aureimonas sp. SA4125]|uniref:aminotransferase class IV n=1 Tax=Aureimonas sp. SA4125 TaxID=2826993 RepID=UPI001CC40A9E|nr:aminotransferase class IV [Aureimonas sp. SA4125]BDA82611.1 4-amino-4-deoxychorismate lyase [Aureimonas sp. SA4125]